MASETPAPEDGLTPGAAANAPGSSKPPSSAGSTIDDPDMTDDEGTQTFNDSTDAKAQPADAASTTAGTSNPGSPQPAMKEIMFKTHNFETPSKPTPEKTTRSTGGKRPRKAKGNSRGTYSWVHEGPANGDAGSVVDDDESTKPERHPRRASDIDPKSAAAGAATVVGTRRQANGTVGSVYSGNKIRHLKKDDGVPLWRKDIQYEFLRTVFDDEKPVFTRISDGKTECSFADIYIDAMARSSKTSKILKDKLQQDRAAAKNMAMICLLVNVGRMNTTLNFFPEMRAQLRTYHSIPSLQAKADASAYKQLQDAPRLKSILKGASEDTDEPRTVEAIKEHSIPRTNPVNLIFVLSQYAPKISEMHFFPPQDFFDLVMRHTISSKSRAKAFLWLMWWYLESDFTAEASKNNPFGPGVLGDSKDPIPLKVPEFEHLTEEQGDQENVDTPEEIEFGKEKQNERKRILEEDDPTTDKVIKRLKKSAGDGTDYDSSPAMKDDWEPVNPHPGRGRYKRPSKKEKEAREEALHRASLGGRGRGARARHIDRDTPSEAAATPQPPGSNAHPVLHQFSGTGDQNGTPTAAATSGRRPRPLTQHQLAVEAHRRSRVEYVLALKKKALFDEYETRRESNDWMVRAAERIVQLPLGYDSEDEENSWGMGGMVPNPDGGEEEDYGEEAEMWVRVFRRVQRRLGRWSGDTDPTLVKKKKPMPVKRELPIDTTPTVSRTTSTRRRKIPRLVISRKTNGDVASSQVGGDSDDQAADDEENGVDIDGEDITMNLDEDGKDEEREEGLDDIDRDLLAEGDSEDEAMADEEEEEDEEEGAGSGSDVDMEGD